MRGFPALDFDDYHRRVLPARCRSGAGRAAARDVRGARPIAFLLTDGRAYRLTPGADAIAVEPGAEAPQTSTRADFAFRGAGGGEPGGVTFRRWRYPVFSTLLVGSNSLTLFDGRWYARGS